MARGVSAASSAIEENMQPAPIQEATDHHCLCSSTYDSRFKWPSYDRASSRHRLKQLAGAFAGGGNETHSGDPNG